MAHVGQVVRSCCCCCCFSHNTFSSLSRAGGKGRGMREGMGPFVSPGVGSTEKTDSLHHIDASSIDNQSSPHTARRQPHGRHCCCCSSLSTFFRGSNGTKWIPLGGDPQRLRPPAAAGTFDTRPVVQRRNLVGWPATCKKPAQPTTRCAQVADGRPAPPARRRHSLRPLPRDLPAVASIAARWPAQSKKERRQGSLLASPCSPRNMQCPHAPGRVVRKGPIGCGVWVREESCVEQGRQVRKSEVRERGAEEEGKWAEL